jgi:hypothetical protein
MSEEKQEFEEKEVELSEISDVQAPSSKQSDITEQDEEIKLEDYEKEMGKSKKKQEITKGKGF